MVHDEEMENVSVNLGVHQNIEEMIARMSNEIANLRSEVQVLNETIAELKNERDSYKRIAELEASMSRTATGALISALNRLKSISENMAKLAMENQELQVIVAEVGRTNQSLTNVLDKLRDDIEKYTPKTDLHKTMQILEQFDLLANAFASISEKAQDKKRRKKQEASGDMVVISEA